MNVRGHAAIAVTGVWFLLCDLVQRTFVAGVARFVPSRRERVLARWQRMMAHAVLGIVRRVGGARVEEIPRIPGQPGVLVLMNHQSLLDIPLVVAAMDGRYPKIVTRRLYARGIPLIAHMARLYRYPLVDPQATTRGQIRVLLEAARDPEHPLVIFPEGHRSRDGEIRPFKTLGLKTLLKARSWTVYVAVADGLWQCARFGDFVRNIASVRSRAACRGPFVMPDPGSDLDAFIAEMRAEMCDLLAELRSQVPV